MSIIGFVILGKTIYNGEGGKSLQVFIFCGLIYGICPTWPPAAFAFASLPMLLTLLIRLYRKFDWRYMILLLLYPVISNFVLFGLFICGYLLMFFIIDWIYNKRPAWRFLGAIIFLSAGYIIVEWRLFYAMLFSGEESIRSAMTFGGSNIGWRMAARRAIDAFMYGHYHSASSHFASVYYLFYLS